MGLNTDNDVINLATTPFFATLDNGKTPAATLDASNCTLAGSSFSTFTCATPGPFGAGGILAPAGRSGNTSAFVANNGSPTLAPYVDPEPGYVQQYNLDVQRELPAGIFVDIAYAGAKAFTCTNTRPTSIRFQILSSAKPTTSMARASR